jgi:hypothetical protein
MPELHVQWIVRCACGAAVLTLQGDPLAEVYCHCDDCQRAHSAAYVLRAIFPREAVRITSGETRVWKNRLRDMTICASCGSHLFGGREESPFRGVNASLFPAGSFRPRAHLHCRYAVMPVNDGLPHYYDLPKDQGGTGELVGW